MKRRRLKRALSWAVVLSVIAVVIACLAMGATAVATRAYSQQYTRRIYPGVSVYGLDLGGKSLAEASDHLRAFLPTPDSLSLTLRDGDRVWQRSWADLGIRYDAEATAQLAYQVGREGSSERMYLDQLRARTVGWPLSPIVVLPNERTARAALEALTSTVEIPAINASLIITTSGVIPTPARAGRELDIERTIEALPHAVGVTEKGLVMELLTRQVAPPIGNPGPAQAQAERLLAQPFSLNAYDELTGFRATWSVAPEDVAHWLTVEAMEDSQGPHLAISGRPDAIERYLEEQGLQVSEEVAIDVDASVEPIRLAIEASTGQAEIALMHPPHPYTVQPGDTLVSIARAHGFPVWRLIEANPTLEPSALRAGDQIAIPSIDVLFPLPLVSDRRIVVDISEQRLRAYEGDLLVHDFLASTGIDSSPTIPGMFQILSKETEAYASSWDLWMPHFMGVYRTGPNFMNGIHGLPTLSNGSRLWDGYLGQPISYGCVVLGLEEAATLFEWTELGTLVVIQE